MCRLHHRDMLKKKKEKVPGGPDKGAAVLLQLRNTVKKAFEAETSPSSFLEMQESVNMIRDMTYKQAVLVSLYREAHQKSMRDKLKHEEESIKRSPLSFGTSANSIHGRQSFEF